MIKVPFGLDETGTEVPAAFASHGVRYVCPDCQAELIPKLGSVRVKHFAHRIEPIICDFRHETEEHYRAKMAIASAINEGAVIHLLRECPCCNSQQPYLLPTGKVRASVEHVLTTNHRADVSLLDEADQIVAVIEVLMHHPVDEEKVMALAERDIAWVEIKALDVIEAPEPIWPLVRDHLPPAGICGTCNAARTEALSFLGSAVTNRIPITLIRTCSECKEPWPQPLPAKVTQVANDFPLANEVAVAAFLDGRGETIALFEPSIAGRCDDAQVSAMRTSGMPWAFMSVGPLDRNGSSPR